ncbi:MAG: hypothetical protein VW600_15085 [Ferrovibrio sp.]
MGTNRIPGFTVRFILIAGLLAMSTAAVAGDSASQAEQQVAKTKAIVSPATHRQLPAATLLAFALMASSGTSLPQTMHTTGGR